MISEPIEREILMAVKMASYVVKDEVIQDEASKLAQVIASPGYIQVLRELEAASPEERPQVVRRLASVEAFKERGIPTPEGLRVSPRVFEYQGDSTRGGDYTPYGLAEVSSFPVMSAASPETVCVSLGWFLCISVG